MQYLVHPPKYPSTGHWRWSPKVHRDDSYHPDPAFFVGREIVITEKIDGGNTCLYKGQVYARSTDLPAHEGWFSMVKNQHAWKTGHGGNPALDSNLAYYGEDIYGVHTLEYDAVHPWETYYLFAVLNMKTMEFMPWDNVSVHAATLRVKTVPEVYRGVFDAPEAITAFLEEERKKPSALGGEREGFVIRVVEGFPYDDIVRVGKTLVMTNACKYVRANHVQTDEHWKENWKPCKLLKS